MKSELWMYFSVLLQSECIFSRGQIAAAATTTTESWNMEDNNNIMFDVQLRPPVLFWSPVCWLSVCGLKLCAKNNFTAFVISQPKTSWKMSFKKEVLNNWILKLAQVQIPEPVCWRQRIIPRRLTRLQRLSICRNQ